MKWIRSSGSEIETNDLEETIKHCESLGWKRKGAKEEPKEEPKKKKSEKK
jgi:hypothetical protein